jgi:hypothetical protein
MRPREMTGMCVGCGEEFRQSEAWDRFCDCCISSLIAQIEKEQARRDRVTKDMEIYNDLQKNHT